MLQNGSVGEESRYPPGCHIDHRGDRAAAVAQRPRAGNVLVTREIDLRGAFRFTDEIDEAVRLLATGLKIDPMITHTLPFSAAAEAFEVASDRTRSSKVLLDFTAA